MPHQIVALALAAIALAAIVIPTASAAAASYFSTTKIVTVYYPAEHYVGGSHRAWCPTGYKVTGGGYDTTSGPHLYATQSMPITASPRQGWAVTFDGGGGSTGSFVVRAICIR